MDPISQTFWIPFSWTKMFEYRLKIHWSLFLGVQLTIFHHWFRQWLGAVQTTRHSLNQWWLDYRRIYASFGLNELRHNHKIHITPTPQDTRTFYNQVEFNTLRPEQNGRHFAGDICIPSEICLLVKLSLKFVREGQIDNESIMVQTKA